MLRWSLVNAVPAALRSLSGSKLFSREIRRVDLTRWRNKRMMVLRAVSTGSIGESWRGTIFLHITLDVPEDHYQKWVPAPLRRALASG